MFSFARRPSTNEVPKTLTRDDHIQQLLQLNPTAACRSGDRSIFEVGLRLAGGQILTLRTTLPPGFPRQAPVLQFMSPCSHPWLRNSQVVGLAELNAWPTNPAAANNLGRVLQGAMNEFCQRPPSLDVGGAKPAQQPPPRQQQPPPPQQRQPPPESSEQHFAIPPVPASFPELESLSMAELDALLRSATGKDGPGKFRAFFQKLDPVCTFTALRDSMRDSNEELARRNLAREDEVRMARAEIESLLEGLRARKREFDVKAARQQAVLRRFDPEVLVEKLDGLSAESEAASEALATRFVDGDVDCKTFTRDFVRQRALYHERAAKVERFRAISRQHDDA